MGVVIDLSPVTAPEIHPDGLDFSKDALQATVSVTEELIDHSDTESEHEDEPNNANKTSDRRRQQNLAFEKW